MGRRFSREELAPLSGLWIKMVYSIGGDFNITRFASKMSNGGG